TCKEHHVNPRDYLNDVIAKMPYLIYENPLKKPSKTKLQQLLPQNWILSHPEALLDDNK
ncbi:MAG: transposase domain-containing protein, partial [Paludibacteraceae bacterium]|nr:transposase domain-containing protein [Paludibacteraceae bacterium]